MERLIRRAGALLLALLALWAAAVSTGSHSLGEALQTVRGSALPRQMLRWQLGDVFRPPTLSLTTLAALYQSPLLLPSPSARTESPASAPKPAEINTPAPYHAPAQQGPPAVSPSEPQSPAPQEQTSEKPPAAPTAPIPDADPSQGLLFEENGAMAETVRPTNANYMATGGVAIRNRSGNALEAVDLASGSFAAVCPPEGPQVLILHTHASEAYTMPTGQEYESSGKYRTADASKSVIRVGDEMAAVLSGYGISVLHARTLHDDPYYNGAYNRSAETIATYLKKYPSITYVLDIHRDAVEDASGRQYKLISEEDPRAAQMCFIMGVNYSGWEENLKLAVAVQRTLIQDHPTLMRPISLINARYNQGMCQGSLLVEVGAAGNSLDEAIYAGRLFAHGFAKTILASQGQ